MTNVKENVTFVGYIRDYVPYAIGATNPVAAGKVSEILFEAEKAGVPEFQNDNFENTRQRATHLISYPKTGSSESISRTLDIIELKFLQHREKKHRENHVERIAELSNGLSEMELSNTEKSIVASTRDWWNG